MNFSSTKISLPSPLLISFYYNYSSLTLFLSWIITPLLLYVILTQSSKLQNFKWVILNHSFWCLAFGTSFSIIKPIILAPAPAGYPLGFMRNGSYKSSMIAAIIILSCVGNCVTSFFVTLLSRYMLIFPSKHSKWLNLKTFSLLAIAFTIIIHIMLIIIFIPILNADEAIVQNWVNDYNQNLSKFLFHESAFFLIPDIFLSKALFLLLLFFAILLTILILFSIVFIKLVKNQNSVTTTKLQKSLFASVSAEILLTCLFLFIPLIFLVLSVYFQISETTSLICILFCFVSTHSFVQFMVTLFFVTPYRKCVISIFESMISRFYVVRIPPSPLNSIKITPIVE